MKLQTILTKGYDSPDVEVIILDKSGNFARDLAEAVKQRLRNTGKDISFKIVMTTK